MIIISFLLEGILSNYIYKFIPLFTLTSIVISSYYKQNDILKYSVIIGILYDAVYTNTIILNSLLFFFISLFILYFNKNITKNIFNLIILNIIIITIYLIINYLLQIILNNIEFDLYLILKSILKSVITNTIYLFILSIVLRHKLFKSSYI